MMLLCWSTLLLCLSANAENIAVCQESGQSVTLECSSAGCPTSIEEYNMMYLYVTTSHDCRELEEVLFYHTNPVLPDKVTPRSTYTNRIVTNGFLRNHTITISNLTVNDSGLYSCVYKKFPTDEVRCNVYTLAVTGVASCSSSRACANDKSPLLVLIVLTTCVISTLVTVIFILLIKPKVKQCASRIRRRRRSVPCVSNDYVYEVMTKNGVRPPAPPEQSSSSLADEI